MCPITNILGICITWEESRLFSLSTQNHRQDSFRPWERVRKLEPKPSEFRCRSSKLSLNCWWETFQTDKFSRNLSSKNHFHRISKLWTVSNLETWPLSIKSFRSMRRFSLLTKTIHLFSVSVTLSSSLVLKNSISVILKFQWKTSSRNWTWIHLKKLSKLLPKPSVMVWLKQSLIMIKVICNLGK